QVARWRAGKTPRYSHHPWASGASAAVNASSGSSPSKQPMSPTSTSEHFPLAGFAQTEASTAAPVGATPTPKLVEFRFIGAHLRPLLHCGPTLMSSSVVGWKRPNIEGVTQPY